ncbi:hypothetical protein V8E55_001124 [Tylopilus felleus]
MPTNKKTRMEKSQSIIDMLRSQGATSTSLSAGTPTVTEQKGTVSATCPPSKRKRGVLCPSAVLEPRKRARTLKEATPDDSKEEDKSDDDNNEGADDHEEDDDDDEEGEEGEGEVPDGGPPTPEYEMQVREEEGLALKNGEVVHLSKCDRCLEREEDCIGRPGRACRRCCKAKGGCSLSSGRGGMRAKRKAPEMTTRSRPGQVRSPVDMIEVLDSDEDKATLRKGEGKAAVAGPSRTPVKDGVSEALMIVMYLQEHGLALRSKQKAAEVETEKWLQEHSLALRTKQKAAEVETEKWLGELEKAERRLRLHQLKDHHDM